MWEQDPLPFCSVLDNFIQALKNLKSAGGNVRKGSHALWAQSETANYFLNPSFTNPYPWLHKPPIHPLCVANNTSQLEGVLLLLFFFILVIFLFQPNYICSV